uniref:Sphingomyelin phosphodiesterase n=1 Tax=Parastrongyloides trichosuri TaxID=131310 RepID=A0A0N4ZPK3_PARTI
MKILQCFFYLFILISLVTCHLEFLKNFQLPTITPQIKCIGCKAAVEAFKFTYDKNVTKDEIVTFARFICKRFTSYTNVVCKGMTSQFKDEFLYVVERLLVTPDILCGLFIDDCGDPKNPLKGDWEIELPPKEGRTPSKIVTSNKIPKTEASTYKVLQISDLHFDFLYTPGSEVQCDEPICCHQNSSRPKNKKKKRVRKLKEAAGYWGSLGACDLPFWTIDVILEDISKKHTDIEYIMLAGDYMSHNDWAYTKEEHLFTVTNLSAIVKKYFPTTPTFWAIGNHEGVPVNSFAPHSIPEQYRPQWIYNAIKDAGGEWLPRETYKDFEYRGSWSVMVQDNLKLVTINTGYCEATNFWLYLNQTDPDESLSWLVNELYRAELDGVYVHILAHVPPGDGECLEGWSRNYYRIINRFADTITGQFFAHVHVDGFTVFYEDMNDINTKPTNVLYYAPSITSFVNLNPAYRIYEIENYGGYHIVDHSTYYYNLSTKRSKEEKPTSELLYTAKGEYNLPDLSPDSWNNLISKIESDPEMYDKFISNYARNKKFICNESCKKEALCSLRRGHHNDSKLCKNQLSISELMVKEGLTSISATKDIVNNIEPSLLEKIISSETFDVVKSKVFNFFG